MTKGSVQKNNWMFEFLTRALPISFVVSMLSTLTYMTFFPCYYLAVEIPASYMASSTACTTSTCLAETLHDFMSELTTRETNRYLLFLAKDDYLKDSDNVALIANDLSSRLNITHTDTSTRVHFRITKSPFWEKELPKLLFHVYSAHPEITVEHLSNLQSWQTDYLVLSFLFLTVLLTCCLLVSLIDNYYPRVSKQHAHC